MTTTDLPAPHEAIDGVTRRLLDEMQNDFPLVERPYEALGARRSASVRARRSAA